MLGLAAVCTFIALAPMSVWPFIQQPLAAWNPAWRGGEPPAPLATLGALQAALTTLAAVTAVALWLRARANGLRRAVTWDCGYAAPTARMQYTGGSFSALAVGWFAWVLQPQRRLRWPRGPFPRRADHVERIPETVLERVIGPLNDAVMAVSAWVRQRQQGHLPDYILYLVAGLVAIGALVVFENM